MLSSVAPSLVVERPYPGLRPFESHEAFLFRGRELHTQALLDRLASEHFLAVVGTSGSGKSSLVRAGLLPALYRGYLVGASTHWRIAVMRPGGAPLAELDRALSEPQALGPHTCPEDGARTSLDVTWAVRKANLPAGTNFLLVVDQFEELFRFESERLSADAGAEAALFVHNLLEAADSYDGRIYVVLTIRSDYLGRCAQFSGLPEALNRAQYLIPHLTREQRQQAIELPPLLAGVGVKPALVQKLLNDLGDDPTMLPVLQHALMRTFSKRKPGEHELTFEHYEQAGGVATALNDHAESLVRQLAEGPRGYVERLFRCLTTVEGGRAVRRPARLDRIYAVLGVADDAEGRREVDAVVRTFAATENSLLVSSTGSALSPESVIDVSHESLIQNWSALTGWLHAEIRTVDWYRSLAGDYLRFYDEEAGPWRDPELKRALALRESDRWNEAWAEQYVPKERPHPTFVEAMRFLGLSVVQQREDELRVEAARQREIEDAKAIAAAVGRSKRLYRGLTWAMVALLALAGVTAYLSWAGRRAERLRAENELALQQRIIALGDDREAQRAELRRTTEALKLAAQGSALSQELQKQKADLQARVEKLSQAQEQLQGQVKSSQGPKSSYSESLIAIADLQAELKEAREKNDELQTSLDTYATVRVRDAGYWKSRAETAEAEVKRLREALASKSGAANSPAANPPAANPPAATTATGAPSIQDPVIQQGIARWRDYATENPKAFAEGNVTPDKFNGTLESVQPGNCRLDSASRDVANLSCEVVLVRQARDTKLSLTWTYPNRYTQGVIVTIAGDSRNIARGPLSFNFANAQQEQQVVETLIAWMSELKSNNVSRVQRAAPVLAGNDQIIVSGANCSVLSTSPTLPARADCTISWAHKVRSTFQAEALGKSLNGSSKQTLVIDRPSGSANAASSYSRPNTLVARPDATSKR